MNTWIKNLIHYSFITSILPLIAACASLPDSPGNASSQNGLQPLQRNKTLHVDTSPGFDIKKYDGLVLGKIRIRNNDESKLTVDDRDEQTIMRQKLEEHFASVLKGSKDKGLRMELEVYDIQPVDLMTNMLSALAVTLPIDRGALTLQASFYDEKGNLQAQRTERLTGSLLDSDNAFTHYGRINTALNTWADQCRAWSECVIDSKVKPIKKK